MRAQRTARLGRLFLDGGRVNGQQIVPADWAARSVLPGHRTEDGYVQRHMWWVPQGGQGDYFAYGHNGQYLYVNPSARVVIVKFSETNRQEPVPMFRALSVRLSHADRPMITPRHGAVDAGSSVVIADTRPPPSCPRPAPVPQRFTVARTVRPLSCPVASTGPSPSDRRIRPKPLRVGGLTDDPRSKKYTATRWADL